MLQIIKIDFNAENNTDYLLFNHNIQMFKNEIKIILWLEVFKFSYDTTSIGK